MPQPPHDSPYRDAPSSPPAAKHHSSSRPSWKPAPPSRGPARAHAAHDASPAPPRSRSKRGRRAGSSTHPTSLTSHPTSRNAYIETRQWLLEQHGPVCAYCGATFTAKVMTLDHVAPRKGQTAYDRRDNLVLSCPGCNMAKRDQAPLSFLLGARSRAVNVVRYGKHLSPMLYELARSLAPAEALLDDDESPYRD